MDAGTVALSERDARESAAKVKVVSVGDAAGPAGLQSPCRLLMLAEARMVLTGEGGVEDRGGLTKVEELTCGVSISGLSLRESPTSTRTAPRSVHWLETSCVKKNRYSKSTTLELFEPVHAPVRQVDYQLDHVRACAL